MVDLTQNISEIQTKVNARKRQFWTFEVDSFLAPFQSIGGEYRMRIPTARQELIAQINANELAKELAKSTGLEKDSGFYNKFEMVCLLHLICVRKENDLPLFYSPQWMLDNLLFSEIEVLWNHYQECLRLSGIIKLDLGAEQAEGLASALSKQNSSQSLDILMRFSNPQLSLLSLLLSYKIDVLKDLERSYLSQIEELKNPSKKSEEKNGD